MKKVAVIVLLNAVYAAAQCVGNYSYFAYELDSQGNIIYNGTAPIVIMKCSTNPTGDAGIMKFKESMPATGRMICIDDKFMNYEGCDGVNLYSLVHSAAQRFSIALNQVCPAFFADVICPDPSYPPQDNRSYTYIIPKEDLVIDPSGGFPPASTALSVKYSNGDYAQTVVKVSLNEKILKKYCYADYCQTPTLPNGMECLPIDRIVAHELFHTLGLGHSTPSVKDNIQPCYSSSLQFEQTYGIPPEEDVLHWAANKSFQEWNITCYEICALRKLYCPNYSPFVGSGVPCADGVVITGISDRVIDNNLKFVLYPNPVEGSLTVEVNSEKEPVLIEVYSNNGELIEANRYSENISNKIVLHLSKRAVGRMWLVCKTPTRYAIKSVLFK